MDLDAGNQSAATNEVSEESRPTALIHYFKILDSIPSIKDLNEMFSCSETKILRKWFSTGQLMLKLLLAVLVDMAYLDHRSSASASASITSRNLVNLRKPRRRRKKSSRTRKAHLGMSMLFEIGEDKFHLFYHL